MDLLSDDARLVLAVRPPPGGEREVPRRLGHREEGVALHQGDEARRGPERLVWMDVRGHRRVVDGEAGGPGVRDLPQRLRERPPPVPPGPPPPRGGSPPPRRPPRLPL